MTDLSMNLFVIYYAYSVSNNAHFTVYTVPKRNTMTSFIRRFIGNVLFFTVCFAVVVIHFVDNLESNSYPATIA